MQFPHVLTWVLFDYPQSILFYRQPNQTFILLLQQQYSNQAILSPSHYLLPIFNVSHCSIAAVRSHRPPPPPDQCSLASCPHDIQKALQSPNSQTFNGGWKSTFRGELSFQRSECTAGLTLTTTFCAAYKDFCENSSENIKIRSKVIYICILYWKKISTGLFGSLALTLSAQLSFQNV